MKQERRMRSSDGRYKAITRSPIWSDIVVEYRKLNTREARVAFVDTFLLTWADRFQESWPVIYQALEWVETDQLYADPRAVSGETFPDFKSYFEARLKRPFTLWIELEETHQYVTKFAPELIKRAWPEARKALAAKNQALDEKDKANQRTIGTNQYSEGVYNNKNDIHARPAGTSAAAFLRRLRKDRPDIHARVLAGELTAHAGMIEAGFRKKAVRRKSTPLDTLRRTWKKATREERAIFRQEIEVTR
jgi:hypothetical protein